MGEQEERDARRQREEAVTFTCVACTEDKPVQGSFTPSCNEEHR